MLNIIDIRKCMIDWRGRYGKKDTKPQGRGFA